MPRLLPGPTSSRKEPLAPASLLSRLSGLQWFDLRQLEGVPKFELVLPNGESFLLSVEGLLYVLERLEILSPESVADYAANFKRTTVDVKTGSITCTYKPDRGRGGKWLRWR